MKGFQYTLKFTLHVVGFRSTFHNWPLR